MECFTQNCLYIAADKSSAAKQIVGSHFQAVMFRICLLEPLPLFLDFLNDIGYIIARIFLCCF